MSGAESAYAAWIGRSEQKTDLVTAGPIARLAALLDADDGHWPADALPPLGHWLFHLPDAPQASLGADGHPQRGGLLPPMGYPRRMWAGGRLRFLAPVPVGSVLIKRTTVAAVTEKLGMTFVTLRHDLSVDGARAIVEEQDLVFLPVAPSATPKPVVRPAPTASRPLVANEAMLFRYSALTFNAHRIHYDLPYARDVEGYAGLVVHGPLQATLLLDWALTEGVVPTAFAFRARAPLHAATRFILARAGQELWIADEAGTVTMTAEIETA